MSSPCRQSREKFKVASQPLAADVRTRNCAKNLSDSGIGWMSHSRMMLGVLPPRRCPASTLVSFSTSECKKQFQIHTVRLSALGYVR